MVMLAIVAAVVVVVVVISIILFFFQTHGTDAESQIQLKTKTKVECEVRHIHALVGVCQVAIVNDLEGHDVSRFRAQCAHEGVADHVYVHVRGIVEIHVFFEQDEDHGEECDEDCLDTELH